MRYCELCENAEAVCPTASPDIGLCPNCFADEFQAATDSLFPYKPCGQPLFGADGVTVGVCTLPRDTCRHRQEG